jgi:hypothetical protein
MPVITLRAWKKKKPTATCPQGVNAQGGVEMFTQDLWFFQRAHELGYKVACDARVRVGHYDAANQIMW